MTFRYRLELKENNFPKDVIFLQYGSLSIQTEMQKYPSGLEYIHNECVGAFIRENSTGDVILYTAKDFGDKIGCTFIPKESTGIYYLSGYDKNNVVDEIMISTEIKRKMPIATKIKEEEINEE